MVRSRMTASRLAYFLASCGSTGSIYPCVLGVVSRGGLVRGASLGTMILVTVIMPDWEVGEGVVTGVEDGGDVDGVDIVGEVDEVDLFDEVDELAGEGVDVVEDD